MAAGGVPILSVDAATGDGRRLPAAGQGVGRRWWPRHARRHRPGRPRGRARGGRRRGAVGVRRRHGVRRALPADRAPHRGAGHGRHPRHVLGRRRPRLLDPAPPPEGRRGGARARRSAIPSARRCTTRRAPRSRRSTTSAPAPSSSWSPTRTSTPARSFFLEMNTRLQVEHPVTEEVFGVDLVAAADRRRRGRARSATSRRRRTVTPIEVRLYAEDPADDWQPQTGTVRTFDVPRPGVRVDSGVESGSVVGIHYDAMIAKVVAHGADRTHGDPPARRRPAPHPHPRRHDQPRLPARRSSPTRSSSPPRLHTALLDERLDEWTTPALDDARDPHGRRSPRRSPRPRTATAERQGARPDPHGVPQRAEPAAHPDVRASTAEPRSPSRTRAGLVQHDLDGVDGRRGHARPGSCSTSTASPRRTTWPSATGGSTSTGRTARSRSRPVPTFVDPADVVAEGSLLAPMPAAVISVAVADGQQVSKGDVVVVLEAMKMQHTITAPTDGVVTELSVTAGAQVESGAVLAVIDARQAHEGERHDQRSPSPRSAWRCARPSPTSARSTAATTSSRPPRTAARPPSCGTRPASSATSASRCPRSSAVAAATSATSPRCARSWPRPAARCC